MKIAIRTKTKKQFPPASVGFIEMEIDLIQNNPVEESYGLRIKDSCIDIVEETIQETNEEMEGITERKIQKEVVLQSHYRPIKVYTYNELNWLSKALNLNKDDFENESQYINELFRQGLLLTTQKECRDGISGEGLGMYFTRAEEWEILRENKK